MGKRLRPRPRRTQLRPKAVPERALNPARHLEELVEAVLAQRIYAVEFAWGFTLVAHHLSAAQEGIQALEVTSTPEERVVLATAGRALETLGRALDALRRFTEEKDLGSLDRGLALARQARFPLDEAVAAAGLVGGTLTALPPLLWLDPAPSRDWEEGWQALVQRQHGETRATFRCKQCGWEFTYTRESSSSEQLELPLSDLDCPLCDG